MIPPKEGPVNTLRYSRFGCRQMEHSCYTKLRKVGNAQELLRFWTSKTARRFPTFCLEDTCSALPSHPMARVSTTFTRPRTRNTLFTALHTIIFWGPRSVKTGRFSTRARIKRLASVCFPTRRALGSLSTSPLKRSAWISTLSCLKVKVPPNCS